MELPEVIGWPGAVSGEPDGGPDSAAMKEHILRTMPIAHIYPCQQNIKGGLEIFKLERVWSEYTEYLKANDIGVGKQRNYLKVMFQEISPMGETYSNTFSPSTLLGGLSEGLSGAAGEIMYITGRNVQENLQRLSKGGGIVGTAAGAVTGGINAAEAGLASMPAIGPGRASQIIQALTSGEKIDFPMMWRGSSWSAQYDMTIRLYNPAPASDMFYEKLIVAPMGALMALALPKTTNTDGEDLTYQWPFLVQLEIPGYVNLDSGYISNLSIVKGGDVNDRSWNNRPNIVDVRLTIAPLFSTMLLTKTDPDSDQPTLKKEMENFRLQKSNVDGGTALQLGVAGDASEEEETINMASPAQVAEWNRTIYSSAQSESNGKV